MATQDSTINSQNPATWLKPDDTLIGADGRDWAWCYIWFKAVPERWGYQVGSDGSLWSCRSTSGKLRTGKSIWKKVKPSIDKSNGYTKYTISGKGIYMHRIVLESFVGTCPIGMEACHNNGIRSDVRLINLRWDTRSGNQIDRVRHGTSNRGSRQWKSKLKEHQVLDIARRLRDRERHLVLAREFGIHESAIYAIDKGENWSHVTMVKGTRLSMQRTEFAKLVQAMRLAQKAYFAARHHGEAAADELEASKALERKVDKACDELVAGQPTLFDWDSDVRTH